MAKSNRNRIDEGLGLLRNALAPYIEREMQTIYQGSWLDAVRRGFSGQDHHHRFEDEVEKWDTQACLAVMNKFWNDTFRRTLGFAERSYLNECREIRNQYAHEEQFSSADTFRALDTMARLARSVSAPEADALEHMADEVQRLVYDEQARHQKRKTPDSTVQGQPPANLKPWREVVTPHADVSGGNLAMARFAADLWQVARYPDSAPHEYANAIEFFRRTFVTEGMHRLLCNALKRVSSQGGEPVIQLQTNFGGGKTHSMLALYHLCSNVKLNDLPGLEGVLKELGMKKLEKPVKPVVIVGNRISPGDPAEKEDGTMVRTLWGEMAWQLGGRKGFELVRKADETGTAPKDESLRKLLIDHGPVLILIDEWVAYARQLHDKADLPGGTFDTHFTFAQELTEVVSTVPNALLVVSLPASDRSDDDEADLAEVGGQRGLEALHRLRNVIGRKDSPWRSATQEESYEIVRRRLFNTLPPEMYKHRDAVVRAYGEMYRQQAQEFPTESRDARYEARLKNAYPIHPELFDELYNAWGNLVKFQRTRGVLRLMAAVIHHLWEHNDTGLLIHPAHVPVDAVGVRDALANYLEDNWVPVIDKDVDGPESSPVAVDRAFASQLGRYSATRRVGRSLFLATAPLMNAARQGVDDARVRLACAQPGETVAIFSDALKKLSNQATYLYTDGVSRYWYSTTPSLNSLAAEEAERLKSREDLVHDEICRRLESELAHSGDFERVHVAPENTADVPDEMLTRLVTLPPSRIHQKAKTDSPARKAAEEFLAQRGNSPRQFKNTLVFVSPDNTRLQQLEEAIRKFLAWKQILGRKNELDLTQNQVGQVQSSMDDHERSVAARLRETYCWLLVPEQQAGKPDVEWNEYRLQGSSALADRASQRLVTEGTLCRRMTSNNLKHYLESIPLFREGDHVDIRTLVEDFARYLYLPKVVSPNVVLNAINEGIALLTWDQDSFAYSDAYNAEKDRYEGIHFGSMRTLDPSSPGLVVRNTRAADQVKAERPTSDNNFGSTGPTVTNTDTSETETARGDDQSTSESEPIREFHASATLDPVRVARDVARISEEIIQHLQNQQASSVELRLEITAHLEDGFDERTIRTVTENCLTLKVNGGFE